jgi:phosphonate transport system substrate-binding protein
MLNGADRLWRKLARQKARTREPRRQFRQSPFLSSQPNIVQVRINESYSRARICCALLLLGWACSASASAPDHYRLGVLPLQSPTKLAGMFMPLVGLVEQSLGRPVQFVTAPSFSRFMERVAQRQYDIVYLNPLLYAQARQFGYRAVAKIAGEPFTGILVARRGSGIELNDPHKLPTGLRIGFPDPEAYAATVMTRQYLSELGIDVDKRFQVEYFGSQDSALLALHAGLVDLVGTWRPSYRSMSRAIRDDLEVIAETPPQPQMPVAVRDDMPPAQARRLVSLLTHLDDTAQGRLALEAMGFRQGFAVASDDEYLGIGHEHHAEH